MIHASNPQYFSAGAMALLIHGLLFLALVFSVSWRSLPELPVYADLWSSLPPPQETERPIEVVPPPEPPPLLPQADPAPPPQAAKAADIALEEAQRERRRKEREQQQQALREKTAAEQRHHQERLAEQRRVAQEAQRLAEEQRRQEEARRLAEATRLAEEQARQALAAELEQDLARQMAVDLEAETRRLQRREALSAQTAARTKLISEFQERIRAKIRGHLRLPPNLAGNPEVTFQVRLLPDGEVLGISTTRSSGNAAYDEAVERAILKASPLPLPSDKEAAAAFRQGLTLKFRSDDGAMP